MTRVVEAIFEDGVLKPLEPLPLTNQQHVTLTVHDSVEGPEPPNARRAEMRWIGDDVCAISAVTRIMRHESKRTGLETTQAQARGRPDRLNV